MTFTNRLMATVLAFNMGTAAAASDPAPALYLGLSAGMDTVMQKFMQSGTDAADFNAKLKRHHLSLIAGYKWTRGNWEMGPELLVRLNAHHAGISDLDAKTTDSTKKRHVKRFDLQHHQGGEVTGRLGYSFAMAGDVGPTVYVKGGYVFQPISYTVEKRLNTGRAVVKTLHHQRKTLHGAVAGVGVDFAINKIRCGLEYVHHFHAKTETEPHHLHLRSNSVRVRLLHTF